MALLCEQRIDILFPAKNSHRNHIFGEVCNVYFHFESESVMVKRSDRLRHYEERSYSEKEQSYSENSQKLFISHTITAFLTGISEGGGGGVCVWGDGGGVCEAGGGGQI